MSTEGSENVHGSRTGTRVSRNESDLRNGFSSLLSVSRRCKSCVNNNRSRVLFKTIIKHKDFSKNICSRHCQTCALKSKAFTNETERYVDGYTADLEEKCCTVTCRNGTSNSLMTKARRKILQKWMVAKMRKKSGYPTIHEVQNEEGN
jgi:hypothetical protein